MPGDDHDDGVDFVQRYLEKICDGATWQLNGSSSLYIFRQRSLAQTKLRTCRLDLQWKHLICLPRTGSA